MHCFSPEQHNVLWAFLARAMTTLLPMFFRCNSDRLNKPVRKALLIIPAGGCVCLCVCVCECERGCVLQRENSEGSLQTIIVHFSHLPAESLFESDF